MPLDFSVPAKRVDRFGKIRKARESANAELPPDVFTSRLEKGKTPNEAYKQYPHGEKLREDVARAEIRRRVSKAMYEEDKKNLPVEEQQVIIDRQIHRYYGERTEEKKGGIEVRNYKLHSHIEAPHGIRPSDGVKTWADDQKVVSYEGGTAAIAKRSANHMIFSRPRFFADVNSLPKNVESSLRSEGAVYTKEDNLNAVKAQRDATARILRATDNLDNDGKTINPHLAIHLHGKVDHEKPEDGHDFEIGARQRQGKGPLDPRLAFWFADKLKEKVQQKGLKNLNGKEPTVNVVTYTGSYSGSPALTRMRHGDGVLGFKGFGEMFQCLQLEVGSHLRNKKTQQVSDILNELMADFSEEFKTPEDLEKLQKYDGKFEEKMVLEKADLFNVKKLEFHHDIAEEAIALGANLREELEVESGDKVRVNGEEFRVAMMKEEHLKSGKSMMLNPNHQALVQGAISIEKVVS